MVSPKSLLAAVLLASLAVNALGKATSYAGAGEGVSGGGTGLNVSAGRWGDWHAADASGPASAPNRQLACW